MNGTKMFFRASTAEKDFEEFYKTVKKFYNVMYDKINNAKGEK